VITVEPWNCDAEVYIRNGERGVRFPLPAQFVSEAGIGNPDVVVIVRLIGEALNRIQEPTWPKP
jgi:hypothetical protein